jgi:hypothetical protein
MQNRWWIATVAALLGLTACVQAPRPATPVPLVVETPDGNTTLAIDTAAAPELEEWARTRLAPVLAQWYPKLGALLPSEGYVAPNYVHIVFRPQPGVAETAGTEISGNSQWFRNQLNGEAVGAMVHELVHVVQRYGERDPEPTPGWLTEGIADYIRFFKFEPDYHGADDVWLKKQDSAKLRYDGSYRQSANFLDWVSRKYDSDIVAKLNAAARNGTYDEELWSANTGKTSAELGEEWKHEKIRLLAATAAGS